MSRFRPIDLLIFGLLAIMLFWQMILSSELGDAEKVVHDMQSEVRP
jgi:hypothetical protein